MARVLEEKIGKTYKHFTEIFDSLPMRAKEVYFFALESTIGADELLEKIVMCNPIIGIEECKSPIEKIFYLAFGIVCLFRTEELPELANCIYPYCQYEIESDKHRYFSDFAICVETEDDILGLLLVECDGHEFHQKTKQQVEKDNIRQYELKMAGYDILRFSGSQIYNEPFKCANDVFDYAMLKLNGGKNGK